MTQPLLERAVADALGEPIATVRSLGFGLTTLDQDGDLIVKTDFRTVYQALIAEWLGGDPNAIMPAPAVAWVERSIRMKAPVRRLSA